MIELRKIDSGNIWKIVRLSVSEGQKDFVATNTESILEAYAATNSGDVALPFGIYSEGQPVGFLMFGYGRVDGEDDPAVADGNYCLWRFMIDRSFQGRGLGRAALGAALDYLRGGPLGKAEYCWLSYEPENAGARALYRSFGFQETGEMSGDEIVARLKL